MASVEPRPRAVLTATRRESHPLVAIVTPVYNGGRYLRRTMESVQNQTYPNLVHVICNNRSTDDTAPIIEAFRDRRVPILAFENDAVLPLAANWNRAFSHVPKEAVYAKLLCADDLVRADAIERFVAAARCDDRIEVVLSQDVFDDHVRRASLPADSEVHDGRRFARDVLLGRVGWLAFHHFFVRLRDEDRDGRFIDDYWSPDPHVVLRSALRGKIAYIHEPLVYNRLHADSVTGREINKGVQFQLVQMHLLERFGREALGGERGYRRSLRAFKTQSSRAVIRWAVTGGRARSRALLAALDRHGCRPGASHYLSAIFGWPLSSVVWRLRELRPGAAIDEAAFLDMAPSADRRNLGAAVPG